MSEIIESTTKAPKRVKNKYGFDKLNIGQAYAYKWGEVSPIEFRNIKASAYYYGKYHGLKFCAITHNQGAEYQYEIQRVA